MRLVIFAFLVVIAMPAVSVAQTAPVSTGQTTNQTTNQAPTQSNTQATAQTQSGNGITPVTPPPANPHDPTAPTLAELNAPDDSELSRANIELLAKNNELQARIDELTTQVNVLVNERGGQLFLYGVISTLLSFIFGFILASLVMKRK